MEKWSAISLDSVQHEVISKELLEMGTEWKNCSHIPATGSLAKAIRNTGVVSMPIATVIDLVIMEGLDSEYQMKIGEFPTKSDFLHDSDQYMQTVSNWQSKIAGRRIWMTVGYQQHLRDFLQRRGHPRNLQRVITKSSREYIKTCQTLIASGVRPELLKPKEQIAKIATEAWIDLERSYPAVHAIRDDLWIDLDEFEAGVSQKAKSLRSRIYASLNQVFGEVSGPRTIVYHGFYFYTPPQWAFFQLLRRLPDVNQLFIVHDDGRSPVYETWRWYFGSTWNMPHPKLRPYNNDQSASSRALYNALKGEKVDVDSLAGKLEVLECRTPTQFVRQWTTENSREKAKGNNRPRTFAANATEISRYLDRFAGLSQVGKVNLALLPLGSYLFAIHDCIHTGKQGNVSIEFSGELLLDIASSGYLQTKNPSRQNLDGNNALNRALPYFKDCRLGTDWVERAQTLLRLVISEVNSLGPRDSSMNDVERMKTIAKNPLRLAPWIDISVEEAKSILEIIQCTFRIASEIATNDKVSLKTHIEIIKRELVRGMRNLPIDVKQELEAKIHGMSISMDLDVSADGLKEVVNLLLGQNADFSSTGEANDQEMEANELRGLDALGLSPLDSSLHVANLADSTFPSKGTAIGWPYRLSDLDPTGIAIDDLAIEILRTRTKTASLSDLYLLSLALNGVQNPHKVTLSYIAEVGSEVNNPSPILTLLTVPGHRPTKAILNRTGGLEIQHVDLGFDASTLRTRRLPSSAQPNPESLADAAAHVDPTAAAAAIACPRRFAIQWSLGPSASYMSDHHHLILYGNLVHSLQKFGMAKEFVERTCNDLWRQFTAGQLKSSNRKAVVRPLGANKSWLFTLFGKKDDEHPVSIAYISAKEKVSVGIETLVPEGNHFLPIVNDQLKHDICNECPIRPKCAVWFKPSK